MCIEIADSFINLTAIYPDMTMTADTPPLPPQDLEAIDEQVTAAKLAQVPEQIYQQDTQLFDITKHLLADLSIPLSLRNQFYIFWSNVIFGNYQNRDIAFLMLKFKEWKIFFLWYIPDIKWNNVLEYAGDSTMEGNDPDISMDLNMLLNSLEQIYFINLTRGRGGFTVKWLQTKRNMLSSNKDESEDKKFKMW